MKVIEKGRHKGHLQSRDYLRPGPVRIRNPYPPPLTPDPPSPADPPKPVVPQLFVAVPASQRVSGRIYDLHSGVHLGLASDELKGAHQAGVPFDRIIGGMKQTVVIHP